MKYDDASWHYGGDFPSELPEICGAIHSGIFLAWAINSDLAGDVLVEEYPEDLLALKIERKLVLNSSCRYVMRSLLMKT